MMMPAIRASFKQGFLAQGVFAGVEQHVGHVHDQSAFGIAGVEHLAELLEQLGAQLLGCSYAPARFPL